MIRESWQSQQLGFIFLLISRIINHADGRLFQKIIELILIALLIDDGLRNEDQLKLLDILLSLILD